MTSPVLTEDEALRVLLTAAAMHGKHVSAVCMECRGGERPFTRIGYVVYRSDAVRRQIFDEPILCWLEREPTVDFRTLSMWFDGMVFLTGRVDRGLGAVA